MAITPIFVSVQETADMLNLTPWSIYRLLDAGDIKSQYKGKRRLVLLTSVHEYAEALPTERDAS